MHIGNCIREKLREDGRSVSWFARQICCTRSNVYKIFNKSSIDTELLERIGKVLRYNFFEIIAEEIKTADKKDTL